MRREPDDIELSMEWDNRQRRARANAGCACFKPGEGPGVCPGRDRCPLCQPDTDEGDDE